MYTLKNTRIRVENDDMMTYEETEVQLQVFSNSTLDIIISFVFRLLYSSRKSAE
jgi:hypothetical protein